jgi:multidrug efflux pump subunit AcrA (membrane-fusion protein)
MRPGMSVRVEVLGPEVKGALLIPRAALDFGASAAAAASIGSAGGRPRALLASGGAVPVKLGACTALECVVESGLTEGTRLRPRDGGRG